MELRLRLVIFLQMSPIHLKLGPFYWNPVDFNLRDKIDVLFTVLYKMLETQR